MKTIVLGVGNKILGDDGVGIHVVNEVKKHTKNKQDVTVDEATTGGMNLLDLLLGYDKAVIVDAVKNKDAKEGEIKRIPLSDFETMHSCNPHDVSLIEAIDLAEKMGEDRIPEEIIVIAVMMKHLPCEFKETLSEKISSAVPKAVKLTLNELRNENISI